MAEEIDVILQVREALKKAIPKLEKDLSGSLGPQEKAHTERLLRNFRDALKSAKETIKAKSN
jgi:hypothetical protein